MNIKEMSDTELRSLLITCDYKGKEVKTEALDELLRRASSEGAAMMALTSGPILY